MREQRKAPVRPTAMSAFQVSRGKCSRRDQGWPGLAVFDLGVVGGVVDEDVDAAEPGEDLVAGFGERVLGGDVGGEAEAGGAVGELELLGAEGWVGLGEVEQDDVGAGGGEDGSVMVAEQACAAGDDGDAAGEVEEGVGAVGERFPALSSSISDRRK